jgi:tRNA threonylcarbamoyladenosine biosynthesis protein TsaE
MKLTSHSADHTREIGAKLGGLLKAGDWIGLTGELGAGKTTFTQGLAQGLGVPPEVAVNSPTFILHQAYPGRLTLHHLDLYRLETEEELFEIGYPELLAGDGVCVVEWYERIPSARGEAGVVFAFTLVDESNREVSIDKIGLRGDELSADLEALL